MTTAAANSLGRRARQTAADSARDRSTARGVALGAGAAGALVRALPSVLRCSRVRLFVVRGVTRSVARRRGFLVIRRFGFLSVRVAVECQLDQSIDERRVG